MTRRDTISPRQFVACAFVAALSLLIRRFPRALAERAGAAAVLAAPMSVLPLAVGLAAAFALCRKKPAGVPGLLTDTLGLAAGRVLTGVYGLWFVGYAGFLLRFGAERFLTTVYTGTQPWLFVGIMALVCALAAAGRCAPIARAAMIFRRGMLALVALVALLTAKDLDLALLQPLKLSDLRAAAAAGLEVANLLSIGFFLGFLGARLDKPVHLADAAPWIAVLLGIIALMTVESIGMFGPELTAKMRFPYFMLVRDLTVLGALERLEPIVIVLWFFPDFILISLLLHMAAQNLRFALGARTHRLLAPVCAALAVAAALALPGGTDAQQTLSESLVPLLCAAFAFAPVPALLLAAAFRKKL